MSGLNHRLGVPVLGSCAEETSPVGCLENQCDRKAGAPRLRLGGVWVLACHQTGQKGLPEWLPPHCDPQSKLGDYPALFTLQHSLAWHLELTGPGRKPDIATEEQPCSLGCGLGGAVNLFW